MFIERMGEATIEIGPLPHPTRLLSREPKRSTSPSVAPPGHGQLGSLERLFGKDRR